MISDYEGVERLFDIAVSINNASQRIFIGPFSEGNFLRHATVSLGSATSTTFENVSVMVKKFGVRPPDTDAAFLANGVVLGGRGETVALQPQLRYHGSILAVIPIHFRCRVAGDWVVLQLTNNNATAITGGIWAAVEP